MMASYLSSNYDLIVMSGAVIGGKEGGMRVNEKENGQ